ncbi:MAG: Mrp/NBP35 family ATP-binding protein [Treponema sp.]|nr:Mrp/NBP35 family ATP-binding protein [Treponema sp.]
MSAAIEKFSKMGIKHLIGVVSGKGGVGKSTTSVLLAQALAARGYKTGLLDADITGPSIPRLFGLEGLKGESDGEKLYPLEADQGIKVISVNMFLPEEDEPVIWRGPLLSRALKQFYEEVAWGELDYLVVDFPPGTSDVVLSGFQQLPLDGIVVVVTPQDFVSMIVAKSVKMAVKTNVKVLGMVENMGSMICPHCGSEFTLFAQGQAREGSENLQMPVLARFPWRQELAQRGALIWSHLPADLQAAADALVQNVVVSLK